MKYFASQISDNLHKTPEGYLLAIGVKIGRTGVMEYAKGETPLEVGHDGIVYVSRSAEELFKAETIASFEGKPLTIKHPNDFVNAENWKDLAKGVMQSVRQDGDDLICDILITDKDAIELINQGIRQLSCGYEAEYEQTGEGKGIQKNIIGNHLALVEEGRAGDAYKIKDEKGVKKMSKLNEALKKMFGKTADEVVADYEKEEKKATDKSAYDELVAMFKDIGEKIEKLGQPMDEKKDEEKKEDSKDEEVAPGLEERLKALEEKVTKLLAHESEEMIDEDVEEDVIVDKESEEFNDEEEKEEEYKLTGDEAARVEILAPGLESSKQFKTEALKVAYKTADGKKAIDALTNSAPNFKDESQVNMLFVAASELLKAQRGQDLSKAKKVTTKDYSSTLFKDEGVITAEKMNEINNKFYNKAGR